MKIYIVVRGDKSVVHDGFHFASLEAKVCHGHAPDSLGEDEAISRYGRGFKRAAAFALRELADRLLKEEPPCLPDTPPT